MPCPEPEELYRQAQAGLLMNEDLLKTYARCKAGKDTAESRITSWEIWADGEREAHARMEGAGHVE